MCDRFCEQYDTLNPEKEYQKFLKRKPVVNTCKLYEQLQLSERVKCPYSFEGYGIAVEKNPAYRTSNSEYGFYTPNAYTIPSRYFPRPQKFSNELFRCGMYRNFSLNTQMDSGYY